MGLQVIQSASFRSLLEELTGRVVEEAESDPWTPRWVLTPTATVAARLRILFAARAGERSLGNLRVLPLSRLVRRLCESIFGRADPRWSPFLDLLLLDLIRTGPPEIVPEPLREAPDNYRLLVPTLLDLAEGGFGPDQAEPLLELAAEPDVGELTRRTLRFHVAWTRLLDASGHGWQPLQQIRLIEWIQNAPTPDLYRSLGAEEGNHPKAFLYGFYDFTDLNLEFVASLASRVDVEAFLPGAKRVGFDFANAAGRELALRAGVVSTTELEPSDPVIDFLLDTFPPERPSEDPPPFLSRHRVSSRFAEALSAAVRVLTWCEGREAMEPHEILIVAPDLEPYEADLRRAFHDFRIPLSLVDLNTSDEGPGRPLRMLKRIWADRGPAEWLFAYFREYPESTRCENVDLDGFEKKIRRLGLSGGTGWRVLRDFTLGRSDVLTSARVEFTASEIQLIQEIVETWVEGARPDLPLPILDALAVLRRLASWLPHPELLESVAPDLETFGRVRPSHQARPGLLLDIALTGVSPESRSDRIDIPAVVAASIMRARGLTARGVILLGLSADAFPRRVEEDSLLPDAARARLAGKAGILGHRLPEKGKVIEEMALLFLLTNTSAERIHWVIPETDENGKAVATTPWVQHYLNRWPSEDAMWRRIPRGPAEQARWLHRLDPEKGSFLPPAHEPLLEITRKAYDRGQPDPVWRTDGTPEEKPRGSGRRLGPLPGTVSVTGLERLARCPFRYWADAGLRLRVLDPLDSQGRLHPRERGGLLHRCLEEIARPCREKGLPVSATADVALSALRRDRGKLAAQAPIAFLPPVLAGAALWDMERTIRAYLRAIAEGGCRDGVPLLTESKFERRLEASLPLTLTGKVDRLDDRAGVRYVIDYKSGRCPFDSRPTASQEFGLGFHLQPLLYPWLAEDEYGPARFSYIYLGGNLPEEVEIDPGEALDGILAGLLQLLETRTFVPTSNEAFASAGLEDARPCAGCDFVSLCRRFDVRSPARSLESLRLPAPRRLEAILAVNDEGVGN
jgi:RecB family exonuclease